LSHTSHNVIITLHKSLSIMKIEKQKNDNLGNKDKDFFLQLLKFLYTLLSTILRKLSSILSA